MPEAMVRGPAQPAEDVVANIGRLRHAQARIVQCTEWARATEEVWRSFNQAGAVRQAVAASPASQAAKIYEHAARDAQIMMIARLFDKPARPGRRGGIRYSFPTCREWLSVPGVKETLIAEAFHWPNGQREKNCKHITESIERFLATLGEIEDEEEPNRLRLLRDFRDENIAHELGFDEPRDPPLYRHITELLQITMNLTRDLSFLADGIVIHWENTEFAQRSGEALWGAVATRFPL